MAENLISVAAIDPRPYSLHANECHKSTLNYAMNISFTVSTNSSFVTILLLKYNTFLILNVVTMLSLEFLYHVFVIIN